MKKKINFVAIISLIFGCGYFLEYFLLPYKYSFLLPLAIFLFVLNFLLLAVFIFEYLKTKERSLLWGGILFFAIFFERTWTNLLKILNQ
jgi:hypothetical protein